MRAGASRVDITPPPGFPMGGHSIEGQVAIGTWTRLKARTIYVEDANGSGLSLTITDLWGVPAGLNDRVAELVAQTDGMQHLGREHVVVAATHTHHGPANFATSRLFARFVGPEPGFDPALFDFIAARIADSVVEAVRSARPASVSTTTVDAGAVARNRSLPPFARNPEASRVMGASPAVDVCHTKPLPPSGTESGNPCHAVDGRVRLLTLTDAEEPQRLIGVLAVFGVHPTAMPNRMRLYSGDMFAVAAADAEAALADRGRPVVALFNGPEGDVSPNWNTQGRAETVRLGQRLGAAVVRGATASGRSLVGDVTSRFGWVDLPEQRFVDTKGATVTTAARGLPGTATVGGAEDGRTRWYSRGYVEGKVAPHEPLPGHGPKRPAVPKGLLTLSLPASHVPSQVPIGVYQIGPLVFTTLPGEFTTTMGMRIRGAVAQAKGMRMDDVVALGLASGHLEYFTTPEEYELQHYEGSSTFFGPNSGELIARRSAGIAGGRDASTQEDRTGFEYRPGRTRHFRIGGRRVAPRVWSELAEVLSVDDWAALPAFDFVDVMPVWPPEHVDATVVPHVAIEVRDAAGRWTPQADDSGHAIATVATGRVRGGIRWRSVWLDAATTRSGSRRFVITGLDAARVCSLPFAAASGGVIEPAPACD